MQMYRIMTTFIQVWKQVWTLFIILSIDQRLLVHSYEVPYNTTAELYKDLLITSGYNPEIRPVLDQAKAIVVSASFNLVSIVKVDDVSQSLTCNGFLSQSWYDELLQWNSSSDGYPNAMSPRTDQVWLSQLLLLNSLDNTDPFKQGFQPPQVSSTGKVEWAGGGLFTTPCALDLTKYPFDEQVCSFKFLSLKYFASELRFKVAGLNTRFFSPSSEWDLVNATFTGDELLPPEMAREGKKSFIQIDLHLRRRPVSLMLSVVLPVMILSFLNIFVFVIPVESGEKISYGITVLLAQSVFLTVISAMLPKSTQAIPNITIYISCLIIIAAVAVLVSILVVTLYHMDTLRSTTRVGTDKKDDITGGPRLEYRGKSGELAGKSTVMAASKWKLASKWLNAASLVTCLVCWTVATVNFAIGTGGAP